MERTVQVWGRPHLVSVEQRSKSVWIAFGDYMGQRIECKDRSPGSALKRWADAAKYRGNG
jgi:hypothetical protein